MTVWETELGTKQVDVLIDGVTLDGGKAKFFNKFSAEVFDIDLFSANFHGFLFSGFKVLCEIWSATVQAEKIPAEKVTLLTNIGHYESISYNVLIIYRHSILKQTTL